MGEVVGVEAPPRVVVVGGGRWGRNHVRNYAELGALAGIVDGRPEVAAELASRFDVPAVSLDQALADPSVEAIAFALPPSQNLPLGRRVLESGRHLFVEKPMALTMADAEALCDVAEAADRRLMVGHILQYHPAFLALLDLVRSGELGTLLSIASTRLDFGRIRREEDALWALAPHDVSMVLALSGTEPERVTARGGWHTHPTIADGATVDLGFPGALRAEIRVSWLNPFKEQRLVVIGTLGGAVFDDRETPERKLALFRHRIVEAGGMVTTERDDADFIRLPDAEPLKEECRHFLHCVRTGETPRSDGREGLRVQRVLERAASSLAAAGAPA